ncbi:TadA family conjugal transfer-associated ATPase [Rothia sp. P4278]|uniref:TadA family conjugal transfer-associated ATPase n=1 Tax=Rothia sp. P4278 TaxID=3402658 RepID=UPI003ADD9251
MPSQAKTTDERVGADTAPDDQIQILVRKARSRFFDLEPQDMAQLPGPKQENPGEEPKARNQSPVEQNADKPGEQLTADSLSLEAMTDPARLQGLIDTVLDEQEKAEKTTSAGEPQREIAPQAGARLKAELTGLGPLEELLNIDELTDIFVNGPHRVWYEAAGSLHRSNITFEHDKDVRALATRLILAAGGRLDDAYPAADVQTAQGARVHAILPPLSQSGTLLSIRLQGERRYELRQLREKGMMGKDLEQLLRYLVKSRANLVVSGGTGSGKTTLLRALLQEAPDHERLVLVEDTAELHLEHPHTVSLQARVANAEGRGAVGLDELIRQALRMRPSRLVVGECRGAEVMDMLTAMNTGHSGSGSTLHANSADAVPARLYAMGALAGVSQEAVALQAQTALDYLIHLERDEGQRFVRGVYRLRGSAGALLVEPVCTVEARRRGSFLLWHPEASGLKAASGLGEYR